MSVVSEIRCSRTAPVGEGDDDDEKHDRERASRCSARSRSGSAPLRPRRGRSCDPGRTRRLLRDLDHDAVGEHPGAAVTASGRRGLRMTGADSPVMADSSTDAIPRSRCRRRDELPPRRPRRRRVQRDAARVVRPRAWPSSRCASSAARRPARGHALRQRLGEFANTTVSHKPQRDREREPGGLSSSTERAAAEDLDEPGDGGDHRATSTVNITGCAPARADRAA